MQYDDSNKGVLFREKEKKSDSHPDFKGSINVEGKDYWLSGWVNESKQGQKYFKLSVTPKDGAPQSRPSPPKNDFISEDIPF